MADLTSQLLTRLKAHRLPGLGLGDDFIYPHYQGQSILNLPASICRWLDVPEIHHAGALVPEIMDPLGAGIRKVIFILMDALSFGKMQEWMSEGRLPLWSKLAGDGIIAPVTSIVPSTTSAALTSLWTGCSTAEHGIAGYELWLKEYGVVANMILHSPASFASDGVTSGILAKAGFEPEVFLQKPTLGSHLLSNGVKSYAFQHYTIARSGLSRMFFKDVFLTPFGTAADLWVSVRQLLESRADESLYAWVYWGDIDHYGHLYGPNDERTLAEFEAFSRALQSQFLDRLNPKARRGTLLVLSADHGQTTTQKDPYYDLNNHASLVRRLHIYQTGESRMAYLFIRPGQREAVHEYLERTWPRLFSLVDPAYAVEAGLFGPGEVHPRLSDRLGDLIVIAHRDAYLWWANKENILVGRHGGLSPEEMVVPLLAARL